MSEQSRQPVYSQEFVDVLEETVKELRRENDRLRSQLQAELDRKRERERRVPMNHAQFIPGSRL